MNKSPFDPVPPSQPSGSGGLRLAPFWKRSMDDATAVSAGEPFDALADLFLGEVAPVPAARKAAAQPVQDDDGPKLRLAGTEDDGHEYPLAPSTPRAVSQEAIATRPAAPVLKMASDEDGEARAVNVVLPPPARNPVMECVVLANLPVVGAAWASQYVREVADAAGKLVACLRVEGDFIRLELVGTPPEGVTLPTAEELGTLEAGIDAAAELTDRWVVRCDAGQENLVAACGITRLVTVLSGADQMARESCRPVFERLAGMLGEAQEGGPEVRLALMGAASAEAAEIGEGLAKIAEQTIGRGVAAVVCASKIGGGRSRAAHTLFGGSSDVGLKSMLASVERALVPDAVGKPVFPVATQPVREPTPVRAVTAARLEEVRADLAAAPSLPMPIEPAFTQPERAVASRAAAAPAIPAGFTDIPMPAPVRETVERPVRVAANPTVAATGGVGTLASHVAELKPLALRCPYAEGIELAIDAAGALHLLAQSGSDAAEEGVLAALLVASSWAEAHAAILAAAHAGAAGSVRPTLHLFTDRPKRSRRLLDTALRVHLLAPVSVGGQMGWYCTELN